MHIEGMEVEGLDLILAGIRLDPIGNEVRCLTGGGFREDIPLIGVDLHLIDGLAIIGGPCDDE